MFRTPAAATLGRWTLRRAVSYVLPEISLLEQARASNAPLEGLLSNDSVKALWFQRGQILVDQLNHDLADNKVENAPSDLASLVALAYPKPELKSVYENAALLHNTQFFFESLKPSEKEGRIQKSAPSALLATPSIATQFPNEPTDEKLKEWIIDSFGSIAEFRSLLLKSANAIKGDGYVWLVAQATYSDSSLRGLAPETSYTKLAVMNTYNAGIVDDLIRLGQMSRRQQQQKSAQSEESADENIPEQTNELGSIEDAEEALLYSDRKLLPLLAVDASMRAYVGDYGVFGKTQYLDNVWECIDWDVVARRVPPRFKPSVVFEH